MKPTASQPDSTAPAAARRNLLTRVVRGVARRAVHAWRETFQRRNYVFACDAGAAPPLSCAGLVIECWSGPEPPTGALAAELAALLPAEHLAVNNLELAEGAALWIGRLGGRIAGMSMSRPAGRYRRWFVPLGPADVVVFRNVTLPDFRGRGVCPDLMRHIVRAAVAPGGRALVDCRVYNHASIRSIEKAGFHRIATCAPLTRAEALG